MDQDKLEDTLRVHLPKFLNKKREQFILLDPVCEVRKVKRINIIFVLIKYEILIFEYQKKLRVSHKIPLLAIQKIISYDSLHLTIATSNKKIYLETDQTDRIVTRLYEYSALINSGWGDHLPIAFETKPQNRKIRLMVGLTREKDLIRKNLLPSQKYIERYIAECSLLGIQLNTYFLSYVEECFLSPNQKQKKTLNLSNFQYFNEKKKHEFYLNLLPVLSALGKNCYYETLIIKNSNQSNVVTLVSDLLAQNKTLKSITIGNKTPKKGFIRLINAISSNTELNLTKLDLSNNIFPEKSMNIFAEELGKNLNGLKTLKIKNIGLKEKNAQFLLQSMEVNKSFTDLMKLDLSDNDLSELGSFAFRNCICKFQKEELKISQISVSNSNVNLTEFFYGIMNEKMLPLVNLDISNNKFNSSNFNLFIGFLNRNDLLNYLNISNTGLNSDQFSLITEIVKTKPNAKTFWLNCSENPLGADCAEQFSKMLIEKDSLFEGLFLDGDNFGSKGLNYILKALINNNTLKKLSIARNILHNENISEFRQTLGTFFEKNVTLDLLDISGYGDFGISSQIAKCFPKLALNSSIKTLNLSFNKFTDETISKLFTILQDNFSLSSLIIFGNSISLKSLKKLKELLQMNSTLFHFPLYLKSTKKYIPTLYHYESYKLIKEINSTLSQHSKNNKNDLKKNHKFWKKMRTRIMRKYSFEKNLENNNKFVTYKLKEEKISQIEIIHIKQIQNNNQTNNNKKKIQVENLIVKQNNDDKDKDNKQKENNNNQEKIKKEKIKQEMGKEQEKHKNKRESVEGQEQEQEQEQKQGSKRKQNNIINGVDLKTILPTYNLTQTNIINKRYQSNQSNLDTKFSKKNIHNIEKIPNHFKGFIETEDKVTGTGEMSETIRSILTQGKINELEKLIKSRNSLDLKIVHPDRNQSPLHIACSIGDPKLLSILLRNGAGVFVNSKNKYGYTPLHLLVKAYRNHACILLLSDYGVKYNIAEITGRTPLMLLLKNLSDLDSFGQRSLFIMMVNLGCNPTLLDKNKKSILHLAIVNRCISLVKPILKYQIDIDLQDGDGNTALHLATSQKILDCACLLIYNDADITILNNKNQNIYHLAQENGFEQLLNLFPIEIKNKLEKNEKDINFHQVKKNAQNICIQLKQKRKFKENYQKEKQLETQLQKKFENKYKKQIYKVKSKKMIRSKSRNSNNTKSKKSQAKLPKHLKKINFLKKSPRGNNNSQNDFDNNNQRVQRRLITFDDVITNPLYSFWFVLFLKTQYCHENFYFYKRVQKLQTITKKNYPLFAYFAKKIFKEFLSPNALMPINIDYKAKKSIEVDIEKDKIPYHIFHQSQNSVTNLLKQDSFNKFKKSKHYSQLMQIIEDSNQN
ncbi:leucine-rich repeat isoform f [Anaeramoeba flamelloides]|uniref:Leucine-rich repeat isoform f n=1 Tax=Anaeramoeba flamelloides TaxID=1746091 RepID=A0AAV7YS68_9EUKA|nr:leucine-rich repeat isoform f [Anaeramoeba flamelloides]